MPKVSNLCNVAVTMVLKGGGFASIAPGATENIEYDPDHEHNVQMGQMGAVQIGNKPVASAAPAKKAARAPKAAKAAKAPKAAKAAKAPKATRAAKAPKGSRLRKEAEKSPVQDATPPEQE